MEANFEMVGMCFEGGICAFGQMSFTKISIAAVDGAVAAAY